LIFSVAFEKLNSTAAGERSEIKKENGMRKQNGLALIELFIVIVFVFIVSMFIMPSQKEVATNINYNLHGKDLGAAYMVCDEKPYAERAPCKVEAWKNHVANATRLASSSSMEEKLCYDEKATDTGCLAEKIRQGWIANGPLSEIEASCSDKPSYDKKDGYKGKLFCQIAAKRRADFSSIKETPTESRQEQNASSEAMLERKLAACEKIETKSTKELCLANAVK
jgi:hypothetical protein